MADLAVERGKGIAREPRKDAAREENRRAEKERRELITLTDPEPLAEVTALWRTVAQAATIGIFALLLMVALSLARPVLLPVLAAVTIGVMLSPLSSRADRLGVPPVISAIVLWAMVIGFLYLIIILVSAPIVDWLAKAPELATNIKSKLHLLDRPLAALSDMRNALLPPSKDNTAVGFDLMSMVQPAVLFVSPAIGQVVVFFGTLFFYLLGRSRMRNVAVVFFDSREARLRTLKIMNDIDRNLTSYLSVVAVINCVVGLSAGIIAYLVGLPSPVAWAVLGFILNFVPYIGAVLMELILLAVGLVTFPTLTHALIAPALYLAFTTLEGHFITPTIMGRRLTLNPMLVFFALVFWTWLWGPVGAFLAVPILIMILVVVSHIFPDDDPALPT